MSDQETMAQAMERHRRERPARHIFEEALRQFVAEHAPLDLRDRDDFQRALMMLLRDAMQSQAETFSKGIDSYMSDMLRHHSLQPLNVIFDRPITKGA